jgi:hypothetical protein
LFAWRDKGDAGPSLHVVGYIEVFRLAHFCWWPAVVLTSPTNPIANRLACRLSPALLHSLAIACGQDSAADPAVSWGVPQPLKIGQAGGFEPQAWRVLWTRAHLPVAWATPTPPLRQPTAWTLAKGDALSDPKSASGPGEPPRRAEGAALRLSRDVSASLPPGGSRAAAGALLRRPWWERRRPAASTPLQGRDAAPARPAGCGWRRRG